MRTVQRTELIGENMGPIDWNFDFLSAFSNYGTADENKKKYCDECVKLLIEVNDLFKAGKQLMIIVSGNFEHELIDIGMYDGCPFWRPYPSLMYRHVLGGGEWTPFYNLRGYRIIEK